MQTIPQARPGDPVPLREALAEFLELSDQRDRWHQLALSYWADGYRAGFASGAEVGYGRAVADWKITAAGAPDLGGRTFAQQDRLRYPPDGRVSWIIVRPDKGERCAHEIARVPCPDNCQGPEGAE